MRVPINFCKTQTEPFSCLNTLRFVLFLGLFLATRALGGEFEDTTHALELLKINSFWVEQLPGKSLINPDVGVENLDKTLELLKKAITNDYDCKFVAKTPIITGKSIEHKNPLAKTIAQISIKELTFPEALERVSMASGAKIIMPSLIFGRQSPMMANRVSGEYSNIPVREVLFDLARKAGFTKGYIGFSMRVPPEKVTKELAGKIESLASSGELHKQLAAAGLVLAEEDGFVCPVLTLW